MFYAATIGLLVLLFGATAAADPAQGEMFGLKIGEVLPEFSSEEVQYQLLGPPFVMRNPDGAAEEFDRFEVIITPMSGTVLGVRAIADFDLGEEADRFADRMAKALWARFGASQLLYLSPSACPYEVDSRMCGFLGPDTNRYFRILERYVLHLYRYGSDRDPTVTFIYTIDEKAEENAPALDLLMREIELARQTELDRILEAERSGVLKGID